MVAATVPGLTPSVSAICRGVEVTVVAQEQDETLPFGQLRERVGEVERGRWFDGSWLWCLRDENRLVLPSPVARGVEDSAPEPRVQTSLTAPLAPAAERGDECVLDGILRPLAIVQDRVRDAAELVEPPQIDHLDLAHGCAMASYLGDLL
jgi:hypothetical protein